MVDSPTEMPPSPSDASGSPDSRPTLLGSSQEELAKLLAPVIDRDFRVRQIYRSLYHRGVTSFEEMTDLSKDLRGRLGASFRLGSLEVVDRHPSSDGSTKYLFALADGSTIEAVDIPDGKRRTFCISSQAGCSLGCRFCVTGYWGAGRNLSAGEIVGQVLAMRRDRGLGPTGFNLVFMGMGEPLLNMEALQRALTLLTEELSWQRITVSTAGVVPGILEMAQWPKRPNLAISLHAADDDRRDAIMPINRKYPLAELFSALHDYPIDKGRKLTFEYILINNMNDTERDVDALARCIARLPCKVNLIPINPDKVLGEAMVPPPDHRVDAFAARLRRLGVLTTVRRQRGDDVSAACGQLRAFGRDPRGFRGRTLPVGVIADRHEAEDSVAES